MVSFEASLQRGAEEASQHFRVHCSVGLLEDLAGHGGISSNDDLRYFMAWRVVWVLHAHRPADLIAGRTKSVPAP